MQIAKTAKTLEEKETGKKILTKSGGNVRIVLKNRGSGKLWLRNPVENSSQEQHYHKWKY